MSDAPTPPRRTRAHHDPDPERRAEALKERIYVTFTSLAVVLALVRNAEGGAVEALPSIATIALTAFGTVLTVFVADVIAHMTAYNALPSKSVVAHMAQVSFGALTVVIAPIIMLALSLAGILDLTTALAVGSRILIITLGIVTFIAVRRLRVPGWQKLLALVTTVALGLLVLVVELAIHH